MSDEVQTFVVADPRTFDGDPYDVAARACRQSQALIGIVRHNIKLAELMARNAQLERNLYETPDDARAEEWADSVHGRYFAAIIEQADEIEKRLGLLAQAAAFNPREK